MTKIISYNGESVYINWGLLLPKYETPEDLDEVNAQEGKIIEAYFFRYVSPYSKNQTGMEKSKFKKSKVERGNMGLALHIESSGVAIMKIDGLDTIARFLYENDCSVKNVSRLKGKKVTEYGLWRCEGVGISQCNLETNYLEKVLGKKVGK